MSKSGRTAKYEPFPALPIGAGEFDIWLVSTDRRASDFSEGPSACAAEIRSTKTGELVHETGPLLSRAQSNNWRALIAGLTAATELLPAGSLAHVCCKDKALLQSLSLVDEWWPCGGTNAKFESVSDWDWWERYILARDGSGLEPRNITIRGRLPDGKRDFEILDRLAEQVRAANRRG